MDRITLGGIDVYGKHGVLEAERELGQRFVIDTELGFDCEAALQSDDLMHALDYSKVHGLVVEAATEKSFQLIETLAGRLCQVLLQEFPAETVTVTVHKLHPPIEGFRGKASVTLTRDRNWLLEQRAGNGPSES